MRLLSIALMVSLLQTGASLADNVLQIRVAADLIEKAPGAAPTAVDNNSSTPLSDMRKVNDKWLLSVTFTAADILRSFDVSYLAGNGSAPLKMTVDYPYYLPGTLSVTVEADPQVESGVNAVMDLYKIEINGMVEDDLIDFNARARAVTLRRLFPDASNAHHLSPYDIQAAFKYLESSAALAKQLHIVPDSNVLRVKGWMRSTISAHPELFGATISVALQNASQAVEDIENLEGVELSALLASIFAEKSCQTQEPHLQAYEKLYEAVGAGPDRDRVDKVIQVANADVLSALAHCVARDANRAISGTQDEQAAAAAQTQQVLDAIVQEKSTATAIPKSALAHITSDAIVLRGLRQQLR